MCLLLTDRVLAIACHKWHRQLYENPHTSLKLIPCISTVNVHCGLANIQMIKTIFLSNLLNRTTGHIYLQIMPNNLPLLQENIPLAAKIGKFFQYDGDPVHYNHPASQYLSIELSLNDVFITMTQFIDQQNLQTLCSKILRSEIHK